MRLYFTSDLHGHIHRYKDCLDQINQFKPDIVILGGDLMPHHGHRQESVSRQIAFAETEFARFLDQISKNIIIGLLLGNDDWNAVRPRIKALYGAAGPVFLDESVIQAGSYQISGYSGIPPTPFPAKEFDRRDCKEDAGPETPLEVYTTIEGVLTAVSVQSLFSERSSIEEELEAQTAGHPMIWVTHSPPYGTALDRLYSGRSAGSRAIREWIERNQPAVTLHGHIHESPRVSGQFWQYIGNTLSLNPGQAEPALSAIFIETEPHLRAVHSVYGPVKQA